MLTKLSRAVVMTALLVAGPSFAQTAAEPTAAQISLGRDVIVASGISRSFAILVPQYLDQISTRLTQTRPDLIRDLNTVMEQIKPEFDKRVDGLIDQGARLYAQRMTEDQLKQVAAFFKSPAGVKYVETQPAVLNDLFVAMQNWSQQLSVDMMTRVREEMKKKGHEM